MFKIKNALYIALAITTVSCNTASNDASADAKPALSVEVIRVIPQTFNSTVLVTAELMPQEQANLMAPIQGEVLEVYFKEGQKIARGQKIIRLDDRSWQAQKAGLTVEVEAAYKDYERKKSLLKIEGSSQEEVDNAFSSLETLKASLQQTQVNINLANVRAPFSGRLGLRNFSKGSYLKQGDLITSLTDVNNLKVDFTLAQDNQNSVEVGKKITVIIGKDTLEAAIYAIDPLIDTQSRTLHVRALLKQQKVKTILPGTYAQVLLATNYINNALLVPTQAVVPEIEEQTVYIVKNGKALRKTVIMGNRTADLVHLKEGINSGDSVITTGLLQIKDGMPVQILSAK